MLIPRRSEVYGRVNDSIPRLGTEENSMKKLSLQKILQQQTEKTACFCQRHASERNSESLLIFLSSVERFRTEFREFSVPRNGSERNSESLLLFLFYGIHTQSHILINVGLSRKTMAFPHP